VIPLIHLKGRAWYPESDISGIVRRPTNIQIMERVNRHTIYVVRHEGRAEHVGETLRSGSPMVVDLTAHKGTHRWFGYVDSLTERMGEKTYYTDITGVGLTYPMKEGSHQTYTTLLEAERLIIKQAGLVPIVRGPKSDKPVLSSGRSMWSTLVETAEPFNQYVFSTGTTLNVMPVVDIIEMYAQEAYTLNYHQADEWALNRFEAPRSDNVTTKQVGFGVDPLKAGVRSAETADAMFTSYPSVSVRTGILEQLDVDAIINTAIAEGGGNTAIHAGMLVYVQNVTPGPWWWVTAVTHEFSVVGGTYRMCLELARTRSVAKMSREEAPPTRNLTRVGDFLERVNLEYNPTLVKGDTFVKGATTWKTSPVWRPQT
jgi:hypothetical protein